jgi:hypothetical protein
MELQKAEDLIIKIKNGVNVTNDLEFEEYADFFINKKFEAIREELYSEVMKKENFSSLATSKYFILKQLFADYISIKLVEARNLNASHHEFEAKNIIDMIAKLQDIFKSHDVVDYPEFISKLEKDLSETEVALLFLKPTLNHDELENIQKAVLKALGKKHIDLNDKDDFQAKFFNHPLMSCLVVYKDYEFIKKQVDNNNFEFTNPEYGRLIKTLMKINSKEINEEYQGFISFLIKEDLTKGLLNIAKNENYVPKYLKELLKKIINGVELDDSAIKELMFEIKENHTKNFKLNSQKELVQNISSQFSLNDYGFDFLLNKKNIFLHGHETSDNGKNQNNQQGNTSLILRVFKYDTIGITVLQHNVTRNNENRCWINAEGFKGLLKATPLEEVTLTGLQFDAQYMYAIALNDDINLSGDFLNSNHYIVKSDIKNSQKIINFNLGKTDLELIFEKKNAYLNIFKKSPDFFKAVLESTSTDNQSQFLVIAAPFLEFIIAIKEIEDKSKLSIFTEEDTKLLKEIIEPVKSHQFFNISVGKLKNAALKALSLTSNGENLSEKYNKFKELIANGEERVINNQEAQSQDAENIKRIKKSIQKGNLELVIKSMELHPLSENCSPQSRTSIAKKLEYLIIKEFEQLLARNYNSNRIKRMAEHIHSWFWSDGTCDSEGIPATLLSKKDIIFNSSDYIKGNSQEKVLAELLRDLNKENIILLKAFCKIAELKGVKIICSGIPLKEELQSKLSKKNI